MLRLRWGNCYLWCVFAFLYLPIIFLVVYSFHAGDVMHGWEGFSLRHYRDLFADTRLFAIVIDTVILALISAVVATAIGTSGAFMIHACRQLWLRQVVLSLNTILLVSPDVIIGASLLILFTVLGLSLGFGSVLVAHIAFSIPIVVLMVLPRLKDMDHALVVAARDLGATRWQTLTQVTLPVIAPGMLAGFFMAMTYSLDDFAVTFFVTGNGFSTLSVEIYSRARQGVNLEINALSSLLFALSLAAVIGYYVVTHRRARSRRRRS